MVSARRALLLLTFAVAVMAITPALSQATGLGLPDFSFTPPLECWKTINGVEGCSEQLLTSITDMNINKFLPDCCKAILSIPTCGLWIFPVGLPFGDKVNKFCTDLVGAVPPSASKIFDSRS